MLCAKMLNAFVSVLENVPVKEF